MSMKRKTTTWLKILGALLIVFVIIGLVGPKPPAVDFSKLKLPHYNSDLASLEDSVNTAEMVQHLKPDNQARIIWDTPYVKTNYSIVYLHGNGASQEEGDPIHEALAHRYGCNLFLSRLEGHGLETNEPMLDIDPARWMQSALDAIAVGKAIGDKVILVSCSTGSTLGLYLESQNPGLVDAHIMLSPNIDLYDSKSFLLVQPWGLQMARLILHGKDYSWSASQTAQQYWYTSYRIEGLITLKAIINATMNNETFRKIDDPVFLAYYYLDEDHEDHIVSVRRMKEMFRQLGTPENEKRSIALPDADTHIIGSDIFNDHLNTLWQPLTAFLRASAEAHTG